MLVTEMGENFFHLAETLVHCLSQESSCNQERNDPLQELKVEKIRDPGRMPHL